MVILKRKFYDNMLRWKSERKGKTALLVKGARRVGKSTIVSEFAKREYKTNIIIDFSKVTSEVKSLFEDLSDLNYFFLRLKTIYKTSLYDRESVIVFDEVQRYPLARQAIKHLVQDGRYDYIETGSLMSIKKNIKDIIIPSEETRLQLFPLDFEEFLWALNDTVTMDSVRQFYEARRPMGDAVNRNVLRYLRLYMLIGGMPQSIIEYLETNDLNAVDNVKREIIELYADDFRRIDGTGRATALFKALPSQLYNNYSRYNVSTVIQGSRADDINGVLEDMKDSMVIDIAYHSNNPNVGFPLTRSSSTFKMYMADTGLFVTLAFWDNSFDNNIIYKKLLSDKLSADLGYVYENLVAQILKSCGNELFYYTFPKETSNTNYEIDFLITRQAKICPIEVKSSGYKSHKSLDVFCEKFSSRVLTPYLAYTKDLRKDGNIVLLPLVMLYCL